MTPPIPTDLQALIEDQCGKPISDITPTFGGFSNLTVAAQLDGKPCIIKAATTPAKRVDVQHEAALLPALHAVGLSVPLLLHTFNDQCWSVSVMAALPGRNGLLVLGETPDALPHIYPAFGQVLKAVHSVPLADPGSELQAATFRVRVAQAQTHLSLLALDADLQATLQHALQHPIWTTTTGLVHGDSGLHNILWGAEGLWLLDWEWAGIGPTLLDLAWLRWTLAWRALPPTLWAAFLNSYGRPTPPLTTPLIATLALGQIGMILARVADQPGAFAEWQRRARWTIEHPELLRNEPTM